LSPRCSPGSASSGAAPGPDPSATDHELVGALIDRKQADEIVRAMDAQTLAEANSAAALKDLTAAVDRNTDALERATGEVNDLTKEIVRGGPSGR
jgi:hypothetical protein